MNKIKVIRKFKATFIQWRLHALLGFLVEPMIFLAYMLKLSKWHAQHKHEFQYNDFLNPKPSHPDRLKLYDQIADDRQLGSQAISYLEFGVGFGRSLTWWTSKNTDQDSVFWAFDTYEGLPEDYGHLKKGHFSQEGNFPNIPDDRIRFIKGLFQDTLLETIPKVDFKRKVIVHVDGDLYSSAVFPLTMLYPYLKPGDLIIFDEFGVPTHEFRAFLDFTGSFYLKLKPVGAVNNYLQVVFEVTKTE